MSNNIEMARLTMKEKKKLLFEASLLMIGFRLILVAVGFLPFLWILHRNF